MAHTAHGGNDNNLDGHRVALLAMTLCLLAGCNTLADLEPGPCLGPSEETLAAQAVLDSQGGCFGIPLSVAPSGEVLEIDRAELVRVGTIASGSQSILAMAARERPDEPGVQDVVYVEGLQSASTLTLRRIGYDLSGPEPVALGTSVELTTFAPRSPESGERAVLPAVFPTVAGLEIVELGGRSLVIVGREDLSLLWGDLDAEPFALRPVEIRSDEFDPTRWTATRAALALDYVASEKALLLPYTDLSAYALFLGQNSNMLAYGQLELDGETLALDAHVTPRAEVTRTPGASGLAASTRHLHVDDIQPLVASSQSAQRLFAMAGMAVDVSAQAPGGLECTLGSSCSLRLSNGTPLLQTGFYNGEGQPPTLFDASIAGSNHAQVLAQLREATRQLVSDAIGTDVPLAKIGVATLGAAGVDDFVLTVSTPVFFGCIDAQTGALRVCDADTPDGVIGLPIGTMSTVWTLVDGQPRAVASNIAEGVFTQAVGAFAPGVLADVSAPPLMGFYTVVRDDAERVHGVFSMLSLASGVESPPTVLSMLGEPPTTDPINFGIAGPLVLLPVGGDVDVYAIVPR